MGTRGHGDAIQTPSDFKSHGKATLQLQTWHSARSALPPPDHPLCNGSSPPVLAMLCFPLYILNPLLGSQPQAARGKQLGAGGEKETSFKYEESVPTQSPPYTENSAAGIIRGAADLGGGLSPSPSFLIFY